MKKLLALLSVAALLFAVGCSNESVYDVSLSNDIRVTLEGYVFDTEGRVPLADVEVTVSDKTTTTDENGYYSVSGLLSGDYTVKVVKDGYFTEVHETTIDYVATDYSGDQYQQTGAIYLEQNTGSLTINVEVPSVEYSDASDSWVRSTNADGDYKWDDLPVGTEVVVTLSDESYINKEYTITTTTAGEITFSNIPNSGSLTFSIEYIVEDSDGDVRFYGDTEIETDLISYPTAYRLAWESIGESYTSI